MPSLTPFSLSLLLRFLNAVLSRAFFQPDEYWQSLEVAHHLVFGYGCKSWEWRLVGGDDLVGEGTGGGLLGLLGGGGGGGIRSPLYPLVFVPVYWAVKVLGLEETGMLTLAPRLLQAVIAALNDVAVRKLAIRLLGKKYGNVALLCSLASFFNAHTMTRTFSNSTETALTTLAFAWWPWEESEDTERERKRAEEIKGHEKETSTKESNLVVALSLAALASIMRPSNAVIWLLLGSNLLYTTKDTSRRIQVLTTTAIIASLAIVLSLTLDTFFYGTPTFTPLRFLYQNVFNSISLFYGANVWHFYFSQAIPLMTFTQLPFVLHGAWTLFSRQSSPRRDRLTSARTLLQITFATICVYSLLGHKEWRFIHPLLPPLHLLSAYSLVNLASSSSTSSTAPSHLPLRRTHLLILLFSLPPVLYLTSFHGLGQVTILSSLRQLDQKGELKSVGFLMPCHSTPWQSHLHRKKLEIGGPSGDGGGAWFVGCEPPVLGQDPKTYLDQTDLFYASPSRYLLDNFPQQVATDWPPFNLAGPTWPSHLVVFSNLLEEDGVGRLLIEKGYVERERRWNSLWHEDERRRGEVVLLEWKGGK